MDCPKQIGVYGQLIYRPYIPWTEDGPWHFGNRRKQRCPTVPFLVDVPAGCLVAQQRRRPREEVTLRQTDSITAVCKP